MPKPGKKVYELLNQNYRTNCYHNAILEARILASRKSIPILVVYWGPQSGLPRNKTADPRKVSFYVTPKGEHDFAKTPDGFYHEPAGTRGKTWT